MHQLGFNKEIFISRMHGANIKYIYIYIYVCVCVCVCVYTYIYVCVCVCIYIIYMYVCVCVGLQALYTQMRSKGWYQFEKDLPCLCVYRCTVQNETVSGNVL